MLARPDQSHGAEVIDIKAVRGMGDNSKPRKRLRLSAKIKIRKAFDWTCQYCGYVCPEDDRSPHFSEVACKEHDYASRQSLHIDRIIPKALGGDYSFSNITLACRKCNIAKAASAPVKSVKSYAELLGGLK